MRKKRKQNKVNEHFHPRGLARAVVHNMMARDDIGSVNKVKPGATQSAFAKNWRGIADRIAD